MSLSKRDWFRKVRREFLLRGIWGKTSRYLLEELEDHYQSTISAFKIEGLDEGEAEKRALEAMGDPKRIAQITSQELHPYWQLVKSCILATSVVIAILTSVVLWLKWSGERDWKGAKAELKAKGEPLTFAELIPPAPHDSENFFADPLWAEYADLVQKKNAYGIETWGTRLSSDEFQLQRWYQVPLNRGQRDRLCKLIPNERGLEMRKDAISRLKTKLFQEKDLQKQSEEATLLLELIAPAQPVVDRISELSIRPGASFPLRYDLGLTMPLPYATAILKMSQTLHEKAFAELVLHQNTQSFRDLLTLLVLSRADRNEPNMLCFLVRLASLSMAQDVIDRGIALHAWTNEQLSEFQQTLSETQLRDGLLFALRGERAFFAGLNLRDPGFQSALWDLSGESRTGNSISWLQKILIPFEESVILKDKSYQVLIVQSQIESLSKNSANAWNHASAQFMHQEIEALRKDPLKRVVYYLNALITPALTGCVQKTAEAQTQVEQSLIACALERYRIAHGSYPASLDQLIPQYLAKLPNSPITGKPMNYSLKPDGTFLLWSPGWELKSLGGKPGEYSGEGDIVWGQPLPKIPREKSKSSQ